MSKAQILILVSLLVAGFAVRLYKIDNPIADWHSWRQADTAAVTRNFFKFGVNPLLPRYDDFSDVSGRGLLNPDGFRFVEFPIYNLVHYTLAKLFPFKPLEFWGRMTSIVAALTSAALIFSIVRRRTRSTTGFLAAGFYLFLPFNIYFTRVILPDPLMVTLFLAALNFFDIWVLNPKSYFIYLTAAAGALAVLVKPAAIFFLLPITWWFWKKYQFAMFKNSAFSILHLAFIIPFAAWRLWELRFPQGIPSASWLFNGDHIRFRPSFWRWLFGERLGRMILGGWGLIPFASGLVSAAGYFWPWAAAAFVYVATWATGNVRHDYYQIPIIPVVSVFLALGTIHLWRPEKQFIQTLIKRSLVIVSVSFMLAFSWYDIRGNFQVNHWEIVHAGRRVDEIVPPDAVVIAPYNGDTAFLYQTNRRGFAYVPFPIKDLIDRFGADYYVSVNFDEQTRAVMDKYIVVEQNSSFVIVKLEEPKKL